MGDNPRHPSRSKRSWSSVGEPGRDVRGTGYHLGKKGRSDSGGMSRRSGQPEYVERMLPSRRTSREYSSVTLEQRSDPYSPKVSRYQSPLKPSPRMHEPGDKECSPRLSHDLRRQGPPRDHPIYPRHHWVQPWSAVGPPAEGRWTEQQGDGHQASQTSRQVLTSDAQITRSFPGDSVLPTSSRSFSAIRSTSANGDERTAVKLEPRGVGSGQQSSFKSDVEDVKLEPRTRTADENDQGRDTCALGRKKRLGFGDSVYKRQQQFGFSIGTTSPKPPDPPSDPPASAAALSKEEESPGKILRIECSGAKECREKLEPRAAETSDRLKETVSMSMAESIVVKMNKLDDEIRELDQKILDTERLHVEVGQAANDLAAKVEIAGQEGNECPEADVTSCLESDNGESQSNFVIMSPSGGSQSGEIDASGKVGRVQDGGGLIEQSQPNGPSSFPPVSASKTLSVRSWSDQDVSTSSRGDCGEQVPNSVGVVPANGDVFGDTRFAQVLEHNNVTAQASCDEVWKGLPVIPEGAVLQQAHQELEIQWDGSRVLPLLQTIQKWKKEQASREKNLAYQYADLLANFQLKLDEGNSDGMVPDTAVSPIRKPSRTCRGARSDYGEYKLVQELIGREDLMTMVKMPDKIVYPWQGRMWINRNRLVKDAAADLHASQERSPWTEEEKQIFMDKFIEHPKDFRKIATFLDKRKTSECIDLYYRIQKLDEFAFVRRKQQFKKRRQHAETKRTMVYPHLTLSPSEKALRFPTVSPPSRSRIRGHVGLNCPPYAGQLRHQTTGQSSFRRYHSDEYPWSDEEFMDAIRCHRTDIRAIAEQYGCKVQLVGTFVLDNRNRLGLDDVFAERDRDTNRELSTEKDDEMNVDEDKSAHCWGSQDAKQDPIDPGKPPMVKTEEDVKHGLGNIGNKSTLHTEGNPNIPWALPRDSSDNLSHPSLFVKPSDEGDSVMNPQSQSDAELATAQTLPMVHPQMFQAPLNPLPVSGPLPCGNIDSPFPAAAGVQPNVALPSFLTPEMCVLLGQGVQPFAPAALQPSPRNLSDAATSVPVPELGIDSLGTLAKTYPGRSVPEEQMALRPSLLSGSSESFTPQQYPHEDLMANDGLQAQHVSSGREDPLASSEITGGLSADASVMSLLLNLLRSLQVGTPAIQQETQINSLLATAIQLLYGAGNPLLLQPQAHQPIPSDSSQQPIPPGQGFHPLFVSPQSASSSMPYLQVNPGLDGLGYLQGIATQHAGQAAGGSNQVGGANAQESLRQAYGSPLVQILLAGMMMHPHIHAALQASQTVADPDRLLYQLQGGLNSNLPLPIPEIPMSASMVQVGDTMSVPALGINPNCPERIWTDGPAFSRDAPSGGASSPGKGAVSGGSEGAKP